MVEELVKLEVKNLFVKYEYFTSKYIKFQEMYKNLGQKHQVIYEKDYNINKLELKDLKWKEWIEKSKKLISKQEDYNKEQETHKTPSKEEIVAPLLKIYDEEVIQDHYEEKERNEYDEDVVASEREEVDFRDIQVEKSEDEAIHPKNPKLHSLGRIDDASATIGSPSPVSQRCFCQKSFVIYGSLQLSI